MQSSVLVLDGNQRSSLAVVRSLGSKGIGVTVGDCVFPAISMASRFCQRFVRYHDPCTEPDAFFSDITRELNRSHYDVIIPMTDATVPIILAHKDDLINHAQIPFVSFDTYNFASNKSGMLQYAKEQGIPIPNTVFCESKEEIGKIEHKLTYPVAIKSAKSRIPIGGKAIKTSVFYAEDYEEVKAIVGQNDVFDFCPFMIQEKINGDGVGLFVLYQNGVPKQLFSHRRLREKPPSGGVSVLCESIPIDPTIKRLGLKILNALNWHGVAMLEFKRSSADGTPYLMEINARFWGSLQLSIDAGVDFPYGLYCTALQKDFQGSGGQYKMGVKNKWVLGNLDHSYILFKERRYDMALRALFDIPSPGIGHSVFKMKDLKPFFVELRQYLKDLASS